MYVEGRDLVEYLLKNWDESKWAMLELQMAVALQSIKLREPDMIRKKQLLIEFNSNHIYN